MLSIHQALHHYTRLEKVSDSARLDCEILLARAVKRDRSYLYTWPERALTQEQQQQFLHDIEQREQGMPVAYIVGEREFWSLTLRVNSSTLIPRPDTELLVETALDVFANDQPQSLRKVIDLGTGTGAIALALASEKPHWQLWGVDVSPQACELATENRNAHHLTNVTIQQSDWLEHVDVSGFDMVISNPPYIDADDPHLEQGDVRFEPQSALVADHHGLADIKTITEQAKAALVNEGWLLFEHGYQQAQAVRAILVSAGFIHCRSIQDMAGHDRVTLGQFFIE